MTNLPMWAPEFRLEGTVLEYKPFPAYYAWKPLVDFTGTDLVTSTQLSDFIAAYQLDTVPGLGEIAILHDAQITGLGSAFTTLQSDMAAALLLKADLDAFNTQMADANSQIDDLQALVATLETTAILPEHSIVFPQQFSIIQTGMNYNTFDSLQSMGFYSNLTINASEIEIKVPLRAGSYYVYLMTVKSNNCGKVELRVNGTLNSTFDLYAAATTRNQQQSSTQLTLAAGLHTFNLKTNGKNASSSAYAIPFSYLMVGK